jgi:hypothetical protein
VGFEPTTTRSTIWDSTTELQAPSGTFRYVCKYIKLRGGASSRRHLNICVKVHLFYPDIKIEVDYMTGTTALDKILVRENELLDKLLSEQAALRESLHDKKWDNLIDTISSINMLADDFKKAESERELLEAEETGEEKKAVMPLLAQVRGKLVRSKIENQVLQDYLGIVRGFIEGVLDQVVPQGRNTVYSRSGKIVHSRPSSVVVNTLY